MTQTTTPISEKRKTKQATWTKHLVISPATPAINKPIPYHIIHNLHPTNPNILNTTPLPLLTIQHIYKHNTSSPLVRHPPSRGLLLRQTPLLANLHLCNDKFWARPILPTDVESAARLPPFQTSPRTHLPHKNTKRSPPNTQTQPTPTSPPLPISPDPPAIIRNKHKSALQQVPQKENIDKMVSLIEQHYEWQGKSFILDISTLNRVFFNRSTKALGVPT